MMNISALSLVVISISTFIYSACALECYVCDNQEDNKSKCVTTIKTCEYGEDVCLTEVKWGSTPYWQQGALKQYYISKKCSTKEYCEKYRAANMPLCTYIWYQDWKCSHCCKGDRCNYYVISGSTTVSQSATAILLATLARMIFPFLWFLN